MKHRSVDSVSSSRRHVVTWVAGVVAAAIILVSSLDTAFLARSLAVRAAVMSAGMIIGAFGLARLAPGGVVDHRNRRAFLLAVLVVHILATLYFFPPSDVGNDQPVVTLDHSFHYYQAYRAREVFWNTFHFDRYDPYFMAGYPGGTIFDLDMKGAETFCSVLPLLGVARALKLFILCAYLTLIPAIYGGSRLQGFRVEEAVWGLLLFLAFWHWGRPYAGDFRYAGMFAFVLVTHVCFVTVGLLRQVSKGKWIRTFFGLGSAAFLVHPTAVVLLPVPFAVSIGTRWRGWMAGRWRLLVAWCVLVVFINLLWLKPFFQYAWLKTTTELYYQIDGLSGLERVLMKPTCAIATAMIAMAVVGLVRLGRQKRASVGLPAAAAALFLFVVAGWGVYMPGIDQLEPGRFLFSAFLFLTPLAGVGLHALVETVAGAAGAGGRASGLRGAALVSLLLASLPLSLLEAKSFYRHTIKTSLQPDVASLVEEIRARVKPPGRLMIEDCDAFHYGDVHLPALLPLVTGVEQIGGPYPHTFLLYYFTSFRWEATFGRPMNQWDGSSLQQYLDLYSVNWVVTATGPSRTFIEGVTGRPPDWERAAYALWEVAPDSAGGSNGGPAVESALNRLVVRGDPLAEGYFIHYHWVPGLEASGAARVTPVQRYDDPVPFIYVQPNGEAVITITY